MACQLKINDILFKLFLYNHELTNKWQKAYRHRYAASVCPDTNMILNKIILNTNSS